MQIILHFCVNLPVHGFGTGVGEGDDDRFYGTHFFRVNRREEELVHLAAFVKSMFAFRLLSADDPESAGFCFAKGIESACWNKRDICTEDDFYTHRKVSLAAMHDLSTKFLMKDQVVFV